MPTPLQKEVLPTAIVTFNTAVGINHGDAPDLGVAAPATGALAGTLKNTSKGTGQAVNNFKWGDTKSPPTYGHTFSEHGAKKKSNQLIDRARGKGHQSANGLMRKVRQILPEVAKKGPGVHEVLLPSSIKSRGYLPDGTEIKPDMARVIIKEDGGIRSAFPYSSAHPSGIRK